MLPLTRPRRDDCADRWARLQAAREQRNHSLCDFGTRERTILAVPEAKPVQRAEDRKGGHFGVARRDRAIGDALPQDAFECLFQLAAPAQDLGPSLRA